MRAPVKNYDCALRVHRSGKNAAGDVNKSVAFTFYNGSEAKITAGGDYVAIGVDEEHDRIYFRPARQSGGYKVILSNKVSPLGGKIVRKILASGQIGAWEARIGNYNLMYDRDENLYYIDINCKASNLALEWL